MNATSTNKWITSIALSALLSFGSVTVFGKVSESVTPPDDTDVIEKAPVEQPPETKPKLEIKGAVTLGTDFRVRGLSFTDGGTSFVGMVHVEYSNFYAAMIGMNADLGSVTDTNGDTQKLVDSALITALGYKTKWGSVELDAGATFYAFPGAFDNQDFLVHGPILGLPREIPLGRAGFFEAHVGIGGNPWKTMKVNFTANWTPEYLYESGENWAFEANLKQLLWHKDKFTLLGVGQLGYNTGDLLDYWYYNAGLTMVYKHQYVFDVRYNNTSSFPLDCSLTKICGGAVVARVGILF